MTTPPTDVTAADAIALLEADADPQLRADLAARYGIRTDRSLGVPMRRIQKVARPLRPNHELAAQLWTTGVYEARTLAVFVDDPDAVTREQMQSWCEQFDTWAIVDTACFHLFDRAADAWAMVRPWADDDREYVRRAGFALLWALALHDRDAPDQRFADHLPLVEEHAADQRPLVGKAMVMCLRAIGQKRPALRQDVAAMAERLRDSDDVHARRVGRPIVTAFADP